MKKSNGCICFLGIIWLFLLLAACGQNSPTWQEQYDLGVRYLSEGKYEEAIIAFTDAIEIDPKQALAYVGRGDAYVASGETDERLALAQADYEKAVELDGTLAEAYLGLADVYSRQGEYEKAREILLKGLEETRSGIIENRLDEMNAQDSMDLDDSQTLLSRCITDNMVQFDEINFLGHAIEKFDIETMKSYMLSEGLYVQDSNSDGIRLVSAEKAHMSFSAKITAFQAENEDYVNFWTYSAGGEGRTEYPIGIRDIFTYESIGDVLAKLGFSDSEKILTCIDELRKQEYESWDEVREAFQTLSCKTESFEIFINIGNASLLDNRKMSLMGSQICINLRYFEKREYVFCLTFGWNYEYTCNDLLTDYEVLVSQ